MTSPTPQKPITISGQGKPVPVRAQIVNTRPLTSV